MNGAEFLVLALIGAAAGVSAGLFGIGGGVIIVPALVYYAGMSQHKATGTSLAVLLPPVGLLAAMEYYRRGNVDLKVALIVALGLIAGGWVGAFYAGKMSSNVLKLIFGLFVTAMGVGIVYNALRRMAVL